MLPPALIPPGHIARELEGFPSEMHHVVLRRGIAERVKELAADHIRGRAQFREAGRIEFQQVAILTPVFNDEPPRDAVTLGADNSPRFVLAWSSRIPRPARQYDDPHPPQPVPASCHPRVPVRAQ